MTPLETGLAFISAINAADLTSLHALMTGDHTFTDALGHSFSGAEAMLSGAEAMLSGWQHFFHAYPNYRITGDHTFADSNSVAIFGKAEGCWRVDDKVLPQTWSASAAWLAEISSGKLRRWTVFCDTAWATPPKS